MCKVTRLWEDFESAAVNYDYPSIVIGNAVNVPLTTEIIFRLEKDVDTHIRYHVDNFNRIFKILVVFKARQILSFLLPKQDLR